ncbi:aromatic-ring-hydroxylating dioxygenase subunit beta [Humitalea sp. 24SJ18S-53]|uniref:aromatic-ring-hydroxylating dioxygenase subunit beta n=1 Tax=Humitalea sp. 24SJ18S-53 TaxID=3422307 RepID=UPI003D67F513
MLDIPNSLDARIEALLLRDEVERFNAEYCARLDRADLNAWTELFTVDCFYLVTSRENRDAGMPVGLVDCEGIGMMRDRAFAILKTSMFGPRYLRHMVSNLRVDPPKPNGDFSARANYMVFEVLYDRPDARILQIGEYHDIFARTTDGELRLRERRCVYDNLLVPTALCLPV